MYICSEYCFHLFQICLNIINTLYTLGGRSILCMGAWIGTCLVILGLGHVFSPAVCGLFSHSLITPYKQTHVLVQYHCQVIIWDRAAYNYPKDTHIWDKRSVRFRTLLVLQSHPMSNLGIATVFFFSKYFARWLLTDTGSANCKKVGWNTTITHARENYNKIYSTSRTL